MAETESRGYYIEELEKGQEASFSKTITEADIVLFVGVSGDANPVHIDEEYAQKTRFGGRIAHGILVSSFISAVLGTILPGPGAIYLSQTLQFKRPVKIGDTVTARVRVVDIDIQKNIVGFNCMCTVKGKTVISGEAQILVPSKNTP